MPVAYKSTYNPPAYPNKLQHRQTPTLSRKEYGLSNGNAPSSRYGSSTGYGSGPSYTERLSKFNGSSSYGSTVGRVRPLPEGRGPLGYDGKPLSPSFSVKPRKSTYLMVSNRPLKSDYSTKPGGNYGSSSKIGSLDTKSSSRTTFRNHRSSSLLDIYRGSNDGLVNAHTPSQERYTGMYSTKFHHPTGGSALSRLNSKDPVEEIISHLPPRSQRATSVLTDNTCFLDNRYDSNSVRRSERTSSDRASERKSSADSAKRSNYSLSDNVSERHSSTDRNTNRLSERKLSPEKIKGKTVSDRKRERNLSDRLSSEHISDRSPSERLSSPDYLCETLSLSNRLPDIPKDTQSRERATPSRDTSSQSDNSIGQLSSRQSSNTSLITANNNSNHISVSRYHNSGKVGLRNLGNTCFMNSIIQCLSNTRLLLEFCLRDDYHLELNKSMSKMKGALITAYVNLMKSMWTGKYDAYISPSNFKTQFQKFTPRFMGYQQQDSQEFLRYLLEGLHADINRVTSKPKIATLKEEEEDKLGDSEKSKEYWRRYLCFDNSKIVDIFVGQLRSELKFSCGHVSVTFDPFWDLSVPIPKGRLDVSLTDCLNLFMKEEQLENEEMPTCSKCKTRKACKKRFSIQKFPKVVVLHLKRFSQEMYRRKLSTCVDFPITSLDLSAFAAEKGGPCVLYNLYAVSEHSGGTHSGHYTAHCKHPYQDKWYEFNDCRVHQARAQDAVSAEAYVLFYELAGSSMSSRL